MKTFYLLPLALLLINGCFNGVNARAQFKDLVDDVLFITLSTMDLPELLNMASTNSRMASIAGPVYQQKYGDYKLTIDRLFAREDIGVYKGSKDIRIEKINLVWKVLGVFGDFISKLYIAPQFVKQILENVREPLKRVESLSFKLNFDVNVLPFDYLFPNLRELILYPENNANLSMIDCVLPKLEALSILIWRDKWDDMDSIDGIIQKNPQVKSIKMHGLPYDYIRVINEAMPTLENITFYGFSTGNQTLRIENVKHLVFEGSNSNLSPEGLEYLSCPLLESAQMMCLGDSFDAWNNFINNHLHLKKLHMRHFSLPEMMEVTANLADLNEIEMISNSLEPIQQIKEFLDSHPKLMKAKFTTNNLDQAEFQRLRNSLQDEWDYEKLKSDSILCVVEYIFVFTRKNSE